MVAAVAVIVVTLAACAIKLATYQQYITMTDGWFLLEKRNFLSYAFCQASPYSTSASNCK